MLNKKLIPVVALLLVAGAAAIGLAGAGQSPGAGIPVPPGEIVESPNARLGERYNQSRPAISEAPPLPATAGKVDFSADFSSEDLSAFRPLDAAQGTWVAREGRLQQRGDAQGEVSSGPAVLLIKDLTFDDGVLEAHYLPTSGEPGGLVFRGSDAGYYRLAVYPEMPNDVAKATLLKITPSGTTELAKAPVSAWPGAKLSQWQLLSVKAEGAAITVSVDGKAIISATDGSFGGGWAGVWSTADMGAQFDNVRVQRLGAGR